MINNYDLIRGMLDFSDTDTYYFLQILKRRKDNPNMERDMIVIDDIFFYNLNQFDEMKEDIIKTCNIHNARAYFRLNKRSLKKSALQTLKRVTDLIISENYKAIKSAYSSVSGEFNGDEDKKWIIDIDLDEFENKDNSLNLIHQKIETLQRETGREPLMDKIPTKYGYHLITRPFNLKIMSEYTELLGIDVDIHKDNPTILYCP